MIKLHHIRKAVAFLAVLSMLGVVGCGSGDKASSGAASSSLPESSAERLESSMGDSEMSDMSSVVMDISSQPASSAKSSVRPSSVAPPKASSQESSTPFTKLNGIGKTWMMPSNGQFYTLATNMDKWKETQSVIDVIGFADHALKSLFTTSQLAEGFSAFNKANIPLVLEVGAIKNWGMAEGGKGVYGRAMFKEQNSTWQRFVDLGANFVGIGMDEPLTCVIRDKDWNKYLSNSTQKLEFAVEQTAEFIAAVREEYPNMIIGDIEAYPYFTANYIIRWIDALEKRLKEKGVKGQDYFRLDVDWSHFKSSDPNDSSVKKGWNDVKRIEDHCRSIGLQFSLIYWSADTLGYKAGDANRNHNNQFWYDSIMQQGERYKAAGGKPDQYVIETWVSIKDSSGKQIAMPPDAVPESMSNSFTRSTLDFYKKFIK